MKVGMSDFLGGESGGLVDWLEMDDGKEMKGDSCVWVGWTVCMWWTKRFGEEKDVLLLDYLECEIT